MVVSAFAKLMHTSQGHPRIVTWTSGEDAIGFVFNVAMAIWLGVSIWN